MGNLYRVVESNIGFENMVSLMTATAEMFVIVSPIVLDVELLQAQINMALKCIEGYKVTEIENKINCSPSNGQPDAIKHILSVRKMAPSVYLSSSPEFFFCV